jgi:universal stress protein A
MAPKKILFCADFSENSRPAWELAVDYAKSFGSQLLILHVIDDKEFPGYVDWGEKLRQILGEIERAANERLTAMAQECAASVKDVKTYFRTGTTAREIVQLGREESVDLIVLGTHGRTGVKHLVMGSVARSVLKTAHLPVLIVEGPPEQGEFVEMYSPEMPLP